MIETKFKNYIDLYLDSAYRLVKSKNKLIDKGGDEVYPSHILEDVKKVFEVNDDTGRFITINFLYLLGYQDISKNWDGNIKKSAMSDHAEMLHRAQRQMMEAARVPAGRFGAADRGDGPSQATRDALAQWDRRIQEVQQNIDTREQQDRRNFQQRIGNLLNRNGL